MTEKRFYYLGDGENINSGVIDGDTELTLEETVGIMNELNDENKELKENVSRLIRKAIIEILDGQRYEGKRILNETLRLLE